MGFDSVDGCVNWTTRVAWHEVQAEWHRLARTTSGEVAELVDDKDPARVVETRFDLDAVWCALDVLSPTDRTAILSPIVDDCSTQRHESAAVKMRRYRARRRLAAILQERNG
jgi:hypothetical protein